jgi:hypothetical protein
VPLRAVASRCEPLTYLVVMSKNSNPAYFAPATIASSSGEEADIFSGRTAVRGVGGGEACERRGVREWE